MATIVKKNVVKREKGKLYFIDKAGHLCSSTMKRKAKKKAAPKKKKTTAKRKTTTKRKTAKKKK